MAVEVSRRRLPTASVSSLPLDSIPFYIAQVIATGEQGVETAEVKRSSHTRTLVTAASPFADGQTTPSTVGQSLNSDKIETSVSQSYWLQVTMQSGMICDPSQTHKMSMTWPWRLC